MNKLNKMSLIFIGICLLVFGTIAIAETINTRIYTINKNCTQLITNKFGDLEISEITTEDNYNTIYFYILNNMSYKMVEWTIPNPTKDNKQANTIRDNTIQYWLDKNCEYIKTEKAQAKYDKVVISDKLKPILNDR